MDKAGQHPSGATPVTAAEPHASRSINSRVPLSVRLTQPVDISSLVVVRIAVGVALGWFAMQFLGTPALAHDFIDPPFHLKYYGFEWVRPWPGSGMHFHFLVMAAAAFGVAAGFFYRCATVVLFVTFTHVFLLDRALYNNHFYLMSLLAFLLCFMPLHRTASLDSWSRRFPVSSTIPAWMLYLLRFQIGVVYFFGGIAKLNQDWFSGQPLRMWLAAQSHDPGMGHLFSAEWVVMTFVWGGLLLDLLAVPLLIWRRSQPFMFVALILFHLINSTLFTIGVFPWLMIALTTVFFSAEWPRRVLSRRTGRINRDAVVSTGERMGRWTVIGVTAYVGIQLLLPMRQFLYEADPGWTENGQQFAWRMMLRQKVAGIRFYGTEAATGRTATIDVRPFLTQRQASKISRNPDLAVQFAHWLAAEFKQMGLGETEIRAKCLVSLNGRKPQLLFSPTVDLTKQPRHLSPYPWVLPLTEPLRHDAWDVPISEWEAVPELSESADDGSRPRRAASNDKASAG